MPCVGAALQEVNPYLPPIYPLLGAPSLQTGYDIQCLRKSMEVFAKHAIVYILNTLSSCHGKMAERSKALESGVLLHPVRKGASSNLALVMFLFLLPQHALRTNSPQRWMHRTVISCLSFRMSGIAAYYQ